MISSNLQRIAAIDILRALIMVLMIFVNEFWSLTDTPRWLEHTEAHEDGIGLSDIVFPAFLFIVGMSLPFSLNARIKNGETSVQLIKHIVLRSVALIVMGLFLVNGEYINESATGVSRAFWNLLCFVAFVFIWNDFPKTWSSLLKKILLGVGVLILAVLAYWYRGGTETLYGFSIHWWGILGLIGWSYLVSALWLVLTQRMLWGAIAGCVLFYGICMLSHSGYLSSSVWGVLRGPLQNGGAPALTLGGSVLAMIYLSLRHREDGVKRLIIICIVLALVLIPLGLWTNQWWIISKILTTPPWVFICSGITIVLFVMVFYVADVKQYAKFFDIIKPAGTNTLTCYLLPYVVYAVKTLLGISLPAFLLSGGLGLFKCFMFALFVTVLAGWCERISIKLKL